jgi:hypothetical protein
MMRVMLDARCLADLAHADAYHTPMSWASPYDYTKSGAEARQLRVLACTRSGPLWSD